MQICYSHLIWLLLISAFVLIHARNIHLDYDYNKNEQRRQIYYHKPSTSFAKKLFNMLTNEQNFLYEHDRLSTMARRAKAIIKGDPREFMG